MKKRSVVRPPKALPSEKCGLKVAVVGIGKVGLPFAVMSSKFHDTIAIDLDGSIVNRVNGNGEFVEPHINEYISKYRLKATTKITSVRDRDMIFVCVGSQTPGVGYSSRGLVLGIKSIIPHLVSKSQVLVIMTTLPPREFKEVVIPTLDREGVSGRILGVCYNPAMIALGKVVKDFESPDYVMIGQSNAEAGEKVELFWRSILGSETPIVRSSIINIAVAKYALNTALVLKISLMALLTELCEKEGADVDVLSSILRIEPRVAGQKMFKGGLGYGGTCFPVDIEALRSEAANMDMPTQFPDAIMWLNDWQVERSVRLLESFGKKKIAILGLSFKPDTNVVAASQSLMIAGRLASGPFDVVVYDPVAMPNAKKVLKEGVRYADSAMDAIKNSEVVFIGVEWQEFQSLKSEDFAHGQVVVDPWRLLRNNPPKCMYYAYGLGSVY